MCSTLNANAPVFTPSNQQQIAVPIFNSGHPSCVRVLDSDEYRKEFLGFHFDREEVCDEDLFNPAVYPVSAADHEELAAAESFNWEMAELEALEHQEELRSLFQARITAVRQGSSGKQRPAKISSLNNAMFSGLPRGAPSSGLKGKRFNPAKKCPHNINQPLQTGRYY
ncbi:unnamed protein product [Hapterophycus canaliculatus]